MSAIGNISYEELRQRQDRTRIYMFGYDELIEMLVQMYNAVDACVSAAAYDNAEAILRLLEIECQNLEDFGGGYDEWDKTLAARKEEYMLWQPFETGHSAVEPY